MIPAAQPQQEAQPEQHAVAATPEDVHHRMALMIVGQAVESIAKSIENSMGTLTSKEKKDLQQQVNIGFGQHAGVLMSAIARNVDKLVDAAIEGWREMTPEQIEQQQAQQQKRQMMAQFAQKFAQQQAASKARQQQAQQQLFGMNSAFNQR